MSLHESKKEFRGHKLLISLQSLINALRTVRDLLRRINDSDLAENESDPSSKSDA